MDFYWLLLALVAASVLLSACCLFYLVFLGRQVDNLCHKPHIDRDLVSDRNHTICSVCDHIVARYKVVDGKPICANHWREKGLV